MATVLHSSYLGPFYVQHSVNDARRSRLSMRTTKTTFTKSCCLNTETDGPGKGAAACMCTYCSSSRLRATEIGCDIQRPHRGSGKKRRASTQLAPEPAVYL